jgi:Uncharacterized protein with SCP/PR1 domains
MRRIIAALLMTITASVVISIGHAAQAADPGAEADFANRINIARNARGLGGVTTHSVLTAKAEAWAQHMADTGCLCHSNLPDGVTVGWRKLGENIGRGPSVDAIHNALLSSPLHYANMVDPVFHWVGVGVAYGGGQMYVAEVFMDGDAPPGPSPLLAFDSHGRGIAARAQGGFWVLQGDGTVLSYEGAPAYGSPHFPGDYARDIAAMPDGNGYVILDALGGVHRFGSALFTLANVGGPWFGFDIARSIAVTSDGKGFAVLDGWGGYHRFGDAPKMSGLPYWHGWDIARAISFRPGGGAYLLDGFGAVWAVGGAPKYGNPYWHWDIARDLSVWPDGKGYAVIDGFGGVHRFGSAKTPGATPWQQIDRWRSMVVQAGTFLAVRNDGYAIRA